MQSKETSQRFLQLTVLLCKLFDPVKTYNANISVPKVYVNMGEVDYSVIKKINLYFYMDTSNLIYFHYEKVLIVTSMIISV